MVIQDKGSVYYEVKEELCLPIGTDFFCPDKTTRFLNTYLKQNFSIIIVNTIHRHEKFKERFLRIAYPSIYFIDCTSISKEDKLVEDNIIRQSRDISLTTINLTINSIWKNITGKKCLYFESGSSLFIRFKKLDVFDFIHKINLEYENEGLVIFRFVPGGLDQETERQLKYLFDRVVNE